MIEQDQNSKHDYMLSALLRLAGLQREAVDRLAVQEAVSSVKPSDTPKQALDVVASHMQVRPPRWRTSADKSDLPALLIDGQGRWGILRGRNAAELWIAEWFDPRLKRWVETTHKDLAEFGITTIKLLPPYRIGRSPVLRIILDEVLAHRALLIEAAAGGLLIAVLGILTSFYTLQVYDRVIPTGALQTLTVLTLGILIAIVLEYFAKRVRSQLYEELIDGVDQRLARTIYLRFLSVRLDQVPASVGSLAGQIRGYETVRSFLVGLTAHLLVDAPFAFLFAFVIAAIAGYLALIPMAFFFFSIGFGLWQNARIRQLTERSQAAANFKTGLLVETVEGAEVIKSGQGGWRMLSRWLANADESRDIDLQVRTVTENGQYLAAAVQQVSYVVLIAAGAYLATRGQLTMGGLIACSILSGRVLTPATQTAAQLIAWGRARAALQGLDAIWALEDDHHGQEQPVLLDSLGGAYRFEQVGMSMRGQTALNIQKLTINPGEKIGVLGPIGAGKTTFLRLLSGMYKPQQGRIWLDDVDLTYLSKPLLAEHIGYLPQEGRLLSGTLRDNLILGLVDPGDEDILGMSKATGLYGSVIAPHPKGLQQDIAEGGIGLSGGQRQLVNLTRVFLRRPRIWLLDEPTASLDRNLELQLIGALKASVKSDDVLVLVTHKPEMLGLVDRLIVIANHQIVLDGPRDAVLARLQSSITENVPAPPSTFASRRENSGGFA